MTTKEALECATEVLCYQESGECKKAASKILELIETYDLTEEENMNHATNFVKDKAHIVESDEFFERGKLYDGAQDIDVFLTRLFD